MPQDQWQDTLAEAAKTDEQNSPGEIDMYRVIAHDAPEIRGPRRSALRRPPKAGGYQSLSRAATEALKVVAHGCCFLSATRVSAGPANAALKANYTGFSAAPVWRIGSLVSRQIFHAREPTPQRRVIHLDGHEARSELARLRTLERAAQKLNSRENHHVDGGETFPHDPVGFRQTSLDGVCLVGDVVHVFGNFL